MRQSLSRLHLNPKDKMIPRLLCSVKLKRQPRPDKRRRSTGGQGQGAQSARRWLECPGPSAGFWLGLANGSTVRNVVGGGSQGISPAGALLGGGGDCIFFCLLLLLDQSVFKFQLLPGDPEP